MTRMDTSLKERLRQMGAAFIALSLASTLWAYFFHSPDLYGFAAIFLAMGVFCLFRQGNSK